MSTRKSSRLAATADDTKKSPAKKDVESEEEDQEQEEKKTKSPKRAKKAATPKTKKGKKRVEDDDDAEDDDSGDDEPKKAPKKTTRAKKAADADAPKSKAKRAKKADDEDDGDDVAGGGSAPASSGSTDFTKPAKAQGHLKLISWNVAGFKAILGKGLPGYVTSEDPDILCLQETKIAESAIKSEVLSQYPHRYVNEAQENKGYAGTAIFSKIKPLNVIKGIGIAEHDKEGRTITLEFDNFFIVTTYIPNSGKKLVALDYRMKWDKDFLAFLKKLDESKPVIWCGDLNVAHLEIDLKNPKTNRKNAGFTDEERNNFTKLLNEGFADSYRHLYPTETDCYTFWTYIGGARAKDVGWRLDYFVVSKRLLPNVVDVFRRKFVMGSDHCPLGLLLAEPK